MVDVEDIFPPHDNDAEQGVLVNMMMSGTALVNSIEELTGEEFYSNQNKHIFLSFRRLFNAGIAIDVISVCDDLRKYTKSKDDGVREYLVQLYGSAPSGPNSERYIAIVKDMYKRRRLQETARRVLLDINNTTINTDELVCSAEGHIYNIIDNSMKSGERGGVDIFKAVLNRAIQLFENPMDCIGLSSGYKDIDSLTLGFKAGELTILAARPSMGKTTLMINMARKIALEQNKKVLMISLEMTSEELGMNMLACHSKMNGQKLRTGKLPREYMDNVIQKFAPEIATDNIIIEDASYMTIDSLKTLARKLKRKHNYDIMFVDYLQLMSQTSQDDSRQEAVANMSRGLKCIAKDLSVPIVAMAQLNRNTAGRSEKRPVMSDLRESGAIEQDADIVMLLHRPAYYDNSASEALAEVIIEKNRNGPTSIVNLHYEKDCFRFNNSY